MLYWECKRRLRELREFRELIKEFFSNTTFDTRGRRHALIDVSELRERINKALPEAVKSCYRVGQSVSVSYNHPAYGISGNVNVLENLFALDRQQIPVNKAIDYLDRAIGEYERQLPRLRRQSWNPFYWLRLGFLWLIGFPFRILGAAGFDARAVEQSLFGKMLKATVGFLVTFVVFLAALLQALSLLGFPTSWRELLKLIHGS
jgi:hypothetical protein